MIIIIIIIIIIMTRNSSQEIRIMIPLKTQIEYSELDYVSLRSLA